MCAYIMNILIQYDKYVMNMIVRVLDGFVAGNVGSNRSDVILQKQM